VVDHVEPYRGHLDQAAALHRLQLWSLEPVRVALVADDDVCVGDRGAHRFRRGRLVGEDLDVGVAAASEEGSDGVVAPGAQADDARGHPGDAIRFAKVTSSPGVRVMFAAVVRSFSIRARAFE
jgi:hypothetical protein